MIQIAGVQNSLELSLICDAKVEFVGFPLRLGYHKEDIPDTQVRDLVKEIPTTTKAVLITYLKEAQSIIELADFIGVKVVQIHSDIQFSELRKLKESRSDISVIKSLVVREDNFNSLKSMALEVEALVDYFITDTFDPSTGAEGATGKTHDWNISRELVSICPKPLILAGGLNAQNVSEAIRLVRPYGVDVHTGVEDQDGYKTKKLIDDFVSVARSSFSKI